MVMIFACVFLFNIFTHIYCQAIEKHQDISKYECERRIYEKCNYPTQFSDQELENVRIFLNYTYTQLADIKPDKPLCRKLHVRQDWKCLTPMQRKKTINIWKRLYEIGFVQWLTDIHVKYWPVWHKTGEFSISHQWFALMLEKAMQQLDPSLTLPYWESSVYGSQPERSSIWETLGTNGSYANGYCVEDGIYGQWKLIPCIKRDWSERGTIYPWYTPELQSYILQAKDYIEMQSRSGGIHFQVHLNVGGYEGQYSYRDAPYDVLFFLHHNSFDDVLHRKWILLKRENLTPLSYDLNPAYDRLTGNIKRANLATDIITGTKTPAREMFWLGFGDVCYIPDQMIKPINNIMTGQADPVPIAIKRLPKPILEKYFPNFIGRKISSLLHMFEDVGDCNAQCIPIPKPTYQPETEQGRKQRNAFAFDNGHDLSPQIHPAEQDSYAFWMDLNRYKYCSPYVTSY